MPRQRRRNQVLRERNERGLSLFFRSLQSVLRIFVAEDIASINSEDLQQIEDNLLDSSATLTLLIEDLSRNTRPISGLPVEMRGRIAALKRDISVVMDFISQIINREHAAEFQLDQQQAYRSQNAEGSHNLGRPYLDITRDQLEHLRSIHFSWKKIAELLNVSYSTVKRRRKEFEMEESRFSNITDNELDIIYANLTSQEGGNLGTPNLGRRRFMGALRSRAIRVQRWRVSECIRRVDPIGCALRWRLVIHRRKYFVPTPNSLWHIDSAHKLIRWKFVVHVAIDGKTRVLIYCKCKDNNKAETVLALFEDGVSRWGLPSRVRSDHGMENYLVGLYMIENRGADRGSIITGSSVHNSRVERTHRDVYCGVLVFYARLFEKMEHENILDPLNERELFCLHYVFLPRINKSLDEFIAQMNNRPVSTEKNLSPRQMWEQGMLENINSDHTAIEDIDSFGIDPDSVPLLDDTDYQVNLDAPNAQITEEEMQFWPDPLQHDGLQGVGIYNECLRLVQR
eukprot:gene1053-381_t